MQRFFSTFPGNWPGAGLLVLRVAVGGVAVLEGAAAMRSSSGPVAAPWLLGLIAVVSGAALLAGFLTPACGAVAGVSALALTFGPLSSAAASPLDATAALLVAADATALVLLGPGALSVDARLFGRREIVVPRESRRGPGLRL